MALGSRQHPRATAQEPTRSATPESSPGRKDAAWPAPCQSLNAFFEGETAPVDASEEGPLIHERCSLGDERVDVFFAIDEYCTRPNCRETQAYCLVGETKTGKKVQLFDRLVPLSEERAPWDPPLFSCDGGRLHYQRSREDIQIPLVRSPSKNQLTPSPAFLDRVNALLAKDDSTRDHAEKLEQFSRGLADFVPDLSRRLKVRAAKVRSSGP